MGELSVKTEREETFYDLALFTLQSLYYSYDFAVSSCGGSGEKTGGFKIFKLKMLISKIISISLCRYYNTKF